jgi:molecular chaperone DnaK
LSDFQMETQLASGQYTISNAPLIHSIGVVSPNEEVIWFLEKGAPLPARQRRVIRISRDFHPGCGEELLRLPVVEGTSARANRNRFVGLLIVSGRKVYRTVPAGSEVEIMIEVDAARLCHSRAFSPVLDEEFEAVLDLRRPKAILERLDEQWHDEKKRLADIRNRTITSGHGATREAFDRIDSENVVLHLEGLLAAGKSDPDAADLFQNRFLDFQLALDKIDALLGTDLDNHNSSSRSSPKIG